MLSIKEEYLKELKDIFNNYCPNAEIWAYGSRIKNDCHSGSDLDLVVKNFNDYTKKYFNIDIKYFSLLRCLTELQIAQLFSSYTKYHKVFKSCNVGSKYVPWKWCCKCAKCLFVYIILSPFLYKDELTYIFGSDLYEDKDLLNTFIELMGYSDTKPFECVGTYEEARYAVSLTIKKLEGENLPYLLQYYKDNYPSCDNESLLTKLNEKNNIDDKFLEIVKEELDKCKKKFLIN